MNISKVLNKRATLSLLGTENIRGHFIGGCCGTGGPRVKRISSTSITESGQLIFLQIHLLDIDQVPRLNTNTIYFRSNIQKDNMAEFF
jgi:hypothetical protein